MAKVSSKLKRWEKGEVLTAKRLNKPVDAVNKLTQDPNTTTRRDGYGRQSKVTRFIIDTIEDDYLKCHEPGSSLSIKIAKPYLLRKTPFDSQTRNGITYTYITNIERSATDGTDTETQVVVPSYVASDQIYAINLINNGTGVVSSGDHLQFVDMNLDGRAWSEKPE